MLQNLLFPIVCQYKKMHIILWRNKHSPIAILSSQGHKSMKNYNAFNVKITLGYIEITK
jgi:hypothetical protein